MEANPAQSKDMIVFLERSCLNIRVCWLLVLITSVDNLEPLVVNLDSKLTSELYIRNMARAIWSNRHHSQVQDLWICFFSFNVPRFEYCCPVWLSAAEPRLKLADRSFNSAKFLMCDLNLNNRHRKDTGNISVLYEIVTVDSYLYNFFLILSTCKSY